jgi:hypothetical protein
MALHAQSAGIALVLISLFTLSQPQSHSGLADAIKSDEGTMRQMWGEIQNTGVESISLNGVAVPAGTSVPPGARLQTLEGTSGTILLGSLGMVSLSQSTMLLLGFDDQTINVKLEKGCATINVAHGKGGVVTGASSEQYTIGPDEHSPVRVCTESDRVTTTRTEMATDDRSTRPVQADSQQFVTPFLFALGIRPTVSDQGELMKGNRPEPFGSSLPER